MKIQFKKPHGNNGVVQAFNRGRSCFHDYCFRYGYIVLDSSYQATDGYYKGFNRTVEIFCNGLLCKIRMNNGDIKEFGYENIARDNFSQNRVVEEIEERYNIRITV